LEKIYTHKFLVNGTARKTFESASYAWLGLVLAQSFQLHCANLANKQQRAKAATAAPPETTNSNNNIAFSTISLIPPFVIQRFFPLLSFVSDMAQNVFQMHRMRHDAQYENLQGLQQNALLRGVSLTKFLPPP